MCGHGIFDIVCKCEFDGVAFTNNQRCCPLKKAIECRIWPFVKRRSPRKMALGSNGLLSLFCQILCVMILFISSSLLLFFPGRLHSLFPEMPVKIFLSRLQSERRIAVVIIITIMRFQPKNFPVGWSAGRELFVFRAIIKRKKKLFLVCYCALLPSLNKRFSDYNYKKTETEIRKEHREMLYTVTHPQTHTRHE